MRFSKLVLLLATTLCFCSVSRADSVGASGTYAISGYATMVGDVPTGCGSSPCVEALQFSFLMSVESDGGTLCGGPCYTSQIIGGPGVTAAIGPMSGPWTVNRGDPFGDGNYLSLLGPLTAGGSSFSVELDLFGFYSYNFLPQSATNYIDAPYTCLDPACPSFYGSTWLQGYDGSTSSYTSTVTQTPEPPTMLLLLFGLIATWGTLVAGSSKKLSLPNPANSW